MGNSGNSIRHSTLTESSLNKFPLNFDAWGIQKTSHNFSIMHSMFTYEVPRETWIIRENGAENYGTSTTCVSINGKLQCSSGALTGNSAEVVSRRNPRYQPNRGYLYSSSIFLPNKNAVGIREFGAFTQDAGVFFRLRNGSLYAVIRTTINGVTSDSETLLQLPDGLDLEKGNIFDIQMQWRGVGSVRFFVGDPTTGYSEKVLDLAHINKLTELTIFNPAMPVAFRCENTDGTQVVLECGCVDITSEGGGKESRQYSSVTSGEVALDTTELPVLAFRIPLTYDGKVNTRDCALRRISAFCDSAALLRTYYFRDPTAITATWSPIHGKAFQQKALNGDVTAFDTGKMNFLHERRIPINGNVEITNPDEAVGDFFLASGDYVLITIQAKNNTLGGTTLEYGQEI